MSTTEHGFRAEVQQLLDLMIHSVYSDREVFLRELVSNAADALDKARFIGLTNPDLAPLRGEQPAIRLTVDAEAKTVTIDDDGVGMTEEEIIDHLGTIARSGTRAFMESMKEGEGAPQLIGRFGLGFYSAFMVASEVLVESRSVQPDAQPVRWRSEGQGSFTVEEGTREHRGTSITLFLRDDATDFAELPKLTSVVKKHSNFLAWPIFVGDDQANTGKALWVEPPSQVTDEEANAFYKTIAVDWQDPARRLHVQLDSPIQVSAMLFVPASRPFDLFVPDGTKGPRLYARRVLIEEHARELLPDWLRFMRGVVDSEDIQLNVSREMVQKTPVVRKIRETLVKRILKDLGKWAKASGTSEEDDGEKGYESFWRDFGVLLKEGYYHERHAWGELILPLLRFNALSHDDDQGLISLAEYKAAMPEDQDTVWFLSADSRSSALSSPHLEAFRTKGYDVLLLTDPVDEWLVSVLTEFDGTTIKSVARGELDLGEPEDQADKVDLSAFAPWVKDLLKDHVVDVRASTRLTDSACVLVDADDGISSNMERILAQAQPGSGMRASRVLEVNPGHPLIKNLAGLHEGGKTELAEQMTRLLYDDALLLEGTVQEPAAMGRRLQELLLQASTSALA